MFNRHYKYYTYVYVVIIEHTCLTQNVLILLCVLMLLRPILVVYYRADQYNPYNQYYPFLLKNTGKIQDGPMTFNKIQVNHPHSYFFS